MFYINHSTYLFKKKKSSSCVVRISLFPHPPLTLLLLLISMPCINNLPAILDPVAPYLSSSCPPCFPTLPPLPDHSPVYTPVPHQTSVTPQWAFAPWPDSLCWLCFPAASLFWLPSCVTSYVLFSRPFFLASLADPLTVFSDDNCVYFNTDHVKPVVALLPLSCESAFGSSFTNSACNVDFLPCSCK